MKKINLLFLILLLGINHSIAQQSGPNLIIDGNFESMASYPSYCSNYVDFGESISGVRDVFYNGCLASYGWQSSVGTADIALDTCHYGDPNSIAIHPPCLNHFATIGASTLYHQREGIFFDNNLSLTSEYIYTLSFRTRTDWGNSSYDATIKLANNLVNSNSEWNLQNVPSQTIYTSNIITIGEWKYVTFDFVPNDTYHQLYFYLNSDGWWGVDDIYLSVKGPYTEPGNTGPCCGTPVTYSNTTLPLSITDKESITSGNNVTAAISGNTLLTAGVYIRFSEGTTLTATANNSIRAYIITCKPKPFVNDTYGAGSNLSVVDTDCNNSGYYFIGGSTLQKGVDYKWTSVPPTAVNYLTNQSSLKTAVHEHLANNTSVVYTLTASNSCGSNSSSMSFNYTQNCSSQNSRIANEDNDLTNENYSNEIIYYPNPSPGSIIIKVPEELLGASYIITDLNGKLIFQSSASKNENEIDLTSQPAGIYFIAFQNKGKLIRNKIIIL